MKVLNKAWSKKGWVIGLSFIIYHLSFSHAVAQSLETQRLYLSGTGCDDMVQWDFKCSDGRNSGKWTKIGVPSCWELQGFGTYQYGMRFYGKATPEGIADERGSYKTEFTLPQAWEGRQIQLVFEAVFTEAQVTINGRKAGNGTYQGGFTRHTIDVSDRVFFGTKKNRLEVEVLKESTNPQVNLAERRADYWNFGGIWRPVFIVSKPMQNISLVAINAQADGRFQADVFLNRALPGFSVSVDIVDTNGKSVGKGSPFSISGDCTHVDFTVNSPKLWNAEQPNLYTAVFTLKNQQGKTIHVERQKFGFRTIEYRHSYAQPEKAETGHHVYGCNDDGVFINGQKVIMKGVNRHSFRPESGRTLSKAKNIEDVKLIKSMNMNAVRLSHYPADPEFLDACDSLGLYVECELPGWHWAHETVIGTQNVVDMVTRDVNHPCIIFWSNGNEGGFNYELESVFTKHDPQQRVVLYPWANRNGFETKHYRSWGETAEYMRQKEIFMPTEFLHGLYDGGHGAGLADYWKLMMNNQRCAGGFLWDLMDQAVLRTDWEGSEKLIVNSEKFAAAIPSGNGTPAGNSSLFTLHSSLLDPVGNFGSDGIVGPHMEKEGSYYTIKEVWCPIRLERLNNAIRLTNNYDFINLKDCKFTYQLLSMPAYGKSDVSIVSQGTIKSPDVAPKQATIISDVFPTTKADVLQITAIDPYGENIFTWSFRLGSIPTLMYEGNSSSIAKETSDQLTVTAANKTYTFSKKDGRLQSVTTHLSPLTSHHSPLTTHLSGPHFIAAKRSDRSDDGFYNHDDKEAFQKKTQYTEYKDQGEFAGFEFENGELKAHYRHGSLLLVVWKFKEDGSVGLTTYTNFNGVVDLMGICFDYPEDKVKSKQWVGCGPYRVWQNRLEGPQYGYWQTDYNDPIPGESWEYPEFKGYFARVKWMQIETTEGKIGIEPTLPRSGKSVYIGVFTPRDGRDHLLYDLPQTGIALLEHIPAVRNKVNTTDLNGPSAQPHFVSGMTTTSAILRFE